MFLCNFLNKVVPRDQLEAEVDKHANSCASNRPTDTNLGSMLSALFESMGGLVAPDGDDMRLGDAIASGLADSVRVNDAKFPPDFRLSKSGRAKKD
jgi:hypothetical protein